MIKFESGSHWYGKDGKPQHDADLRIARKEFLYPSVTTIDKDVFKNDFLDRWKMNELAAAAAGTFKQLHESDEDYANRIYEISLEKSRTASSFGKEVHDAIEHYPQLPLNPELAPWISKFGAWFDAYVEAVVGSERVLLDHDLGVAGRMDTLAVLRGNKSLAVLDYKTQNVKRDKKGKKVPAFYDSWPRQLAFYAVSSAKEAGTFPASVPSCVSVVIDSNEPDDPFVRVWTPEEISRAYTQFVVGSWLWFDKRNYWPQPKGFLKVTANVPMI